MEGGREGRGGGRGRDNSNSKTLFYKDCSLGSERDRQTDRQRQRQKQTDSQTDSQTDGHRDRLLRRQAAADLENDGVVASSVVDHDFPGEEPSGVSRQGGVCGHSATDGDHQRRVGRAKTGLQVFVQLVVTHRVEGVHPIRTCVRISDILLETGESDLRFFMVLNQVRLYSQ